MIARAGCNGDDVYSYGARHFNYGRKLRENGTGMAFLDVTVRDATVMEYSDRAKYIATADLTTELGNHVVEHGKGHVCVLPEDVGGNHHYRTDMLHLDSNMKEDTSTIKYRELFIANVLKARKEISSLTNN